MSAFLLGKQKKDSGLPVSQALALWSKDRAELC